MNFKKFAKLFMLFTLMNLIGTVVWASENTDSAASCESMSDVQAKAVAPAAASSTSQPAAGSVAAPAGR
ncbi:MAG: hypothetical protein H7222_06475 [Methylotenera sp.]|nr:hypothetical protein [Oligoflexia bacterium]